MTGYVVERQGYTSAASLIADVIDDMIANGFTKIYPGNPFVSGSAGNTYKVTLEASATVDPLATTQPWRVQFDVQGQDVVFMYVAPPLQLPADGTAAVEQTFANSTSNTIVYLDILGAVGAQISDDVTLPALNASGVYTKPANSPVTSGDETTKGFINRTIRVGTSGTSYPMSYRLVITPRGMWLGVWEDVLTTETAANFNWVLVQRPVDRTTGATLTTGKAPVFCINCVGGDYWQFTVRENDIYRPGSRRSATTNSTDSEAVLNMQNQVALGEDGKYVVTVPSRLNTSRYRYPHELDMIGVTSADVVAQYSDVPLTFYGEDTPRVYKALQANGSGNTGMRLLVLSSGGGIS